MLIGIIKVLIGSVSYLRVRVRWTRKVMAC